MAVIEFLCKEMSIKSISKEMIVKVFPQAGVDRSENRRYYAQFTDPTSIPTVYSRVSNLRSNQHKVVFYAPYSHQNQLSFLGSVAYKCRYPQHPDEVKCKTRIRFGSTDLYLQIKPTNRNFWTTVDVPNLPPPLAT